MRIKSITYAGHSAVFFESDTLTVAIDPWLEGNPKCPEQLRNPKRLDLIILTHGHSDHAGDAPRLAKHYGAKVVATWELAMIMINEGVADSHVVPMNRGGTVDLAGIKITLTNAYHSSSYEGRNGTVYAGEACGVVLGDAARNFYHAGDTSLFSDMKLIGDFYRPEYALLPIGDRFTMNPKEAAKAASLLRCRCAIPLHWGTFDLLTGTPQAFKKECENFDVEALTLNPGDSYKVA